jgi:hypothetical protein
MGPAARSAPNSMLHPDVTSESVSINFDGFVDTARVAAFSDGTVCPSPKVVAGESRLGLMWDVRSAVTSGWGTVPRAVSWILAVLLILSIMETAGYNT